MPSNGECANSMNSLFGKCSILKPNVKKRSPVLLMLMGSANKAEAKRWPDAFLKFLSFSEKSDSNIKIAMIWLSQHRS